MIKYFMTPSAVTIFGKKQLIVAKSHFNFGRICTMLRDGCQDENKIHRLYDLRAQLLDEFSEYVKLNDAGKIVLRADETIELEKLASYLLQTKSENKDINALFLMLSFVQENPTTKISDFLNWMKRMKYIFSTMGNIICYAKATKFYNETTFKFVDSKQCANTIINVNPKDIVFEQGSGLIKADFCKIELGEPDSEEGRLPPLEDVCVFDGEDLLNSI